MHTKTALITGASRGIGKALAEAFAAAGYDLYLTCIHSKELLHSLCRRLSEQYQIRCIPFVGDMGDYETVKQLFSGISYLDVVINNAGISHIGLLSDMTPAQWHHVMATNLDAVFYTSKLAIPLMLQKKSGRIINISSIWGNAGASMETAYSASKGAVNSFTRALAKELAPSGICVNAIACGVIDTTMNHHLSQEDRQDLADQIGMGRFGKPDEVADLIAYLASDQSSYLTGQVITLDGSYI